MMKRLAIYSLILTVFISGFNSHSREINSPNPLFNQTSTFFNDYQSLSKYVSLRPDYRDSYRAADANCQPITVYLDATGNISISEDAVNNGSTGIGPLDFDTDITNFDCSNVGSPVTVTLTVTDNGDGGDTDTCTAIVTVLDNLPPITPTLNPVTVDCTGTLITPTTTDNCAGTITGATTDSLAFVEGGSTIINWTFDDGNGNSISVPQTYNYDDTTPPMPALLGVIRGECSATATAPTTRDACAGFITGTTLDPLTYNTQGPHTITWTFDDGNGNVSTQTQTVIVDDITAPTPDVANLPDVTGECSATATAPTATDNCSGSITGTTSDPLTYNTQGTYTITWTYDDGNVNTSTQTQTVIVDDITAPTPDVATLPDVPAQCEVTALTPPTATDNCGGTVTVTNDAMLPITTQGTTVVTWTYEDAAGNTSTQTQNVIIEDVTAPTPDVATLPDVPAQCEVIALIPPTATDNCGGTVTVTNDATLPITTQGTTVVTWTYEDAAGNTSTQTQNLVITDTTAPVADLATLPDVPAQCEVTALIPPTATDNCGGTVTVTNNATLPITTQGTTVVTWTYEDAAGNTSTQTQDVIIEDVTAPTPDVATLPDVPAQCEVTALTAPTATDNCGGTVTVTNDATLPITTQGTTVVTWTYEDAAGNTSTQTQNVVITDITAPIADLATLADVTDQCAVTALTPPTATDNCGGTVTVTNNATLPITTQGTTVVTWTYEDVNGNTSTQTQNVVIIDSTAPTFNSCPSSVSRNNDSGACGAIVNFTIPTATDNCGTAAVTQTDTTGLTTGDEFPIGTTILEYTATDTEGNSTVCTFSITVTDSEVPTIVCPAPVTVNADADCEATAVTLGTPTTNDNCGVSTVTNNLASQLPLPVGTHTITWTVTDTAGLTATCTQQVTVVDNTPPVITCPTPNAFYNTDAGQCEATLTFNATATDNCNGSPLISYEITGTPITFPYNFPVGTTTVDVIADDGNGLTSNCDFDVVVQDNEAPTVVCQPITITLDATGNATIVEDAVNNGSTDACGGLLFDTNITDFDCSNIGVNNVILTVTDINGNSATCNTTVTVLDNVQGATATITSSPTSPICSGTPVTFTATGANLGANLSYQWYQGGTAVGTNSATYTTTSLTNGENVYVEITSGPCNTVTTSNTIVMTVNPLLPVAFTLNSSSNPACTGENVTFFVTGLTNGGATPSYQWYVNGTPVGGNTNSYNSTAINNNDVVSVDVSSSLTCANPVPASQSITMTVNPDVTTNLTSANDVQTVCNGTAMTDIVYNITNATNATITGIPTGVTGTYNAGTFTISGTPTQVGVFNYTINAVGCGNVTATGTISVGPDATIDLISPDAYEGLCNGTPHSNPMTPIEFQLGPGATGYTLTSTPPLPAGITDTYNAGTGVITINGSTTQVGTYNYTITTTGCGPEDTIDGVIRVFDGPPVINGSINNTGWLPTNICGTPQTVTFSLPFNSNIEYYDWSFSSANFQIVSTDSNSNSIDVYITETNWTIDHSVTVTAHNPCGTDTASEWIVLLELNSGEIDAYAPDDTHVIYVCEDTESITMSGDSGGLNYSEWTWDDNGAGGEFSLEDVGEICEDVCTGVEMFGGCWFGSWETVCEDITDYTVNSEYTLPDDAHGGQIITISMIGDLDLCAPIISNLEIHILETPEAIISSPSVVCQGDDVVVTGTPNTTVSYTDGTNSATFPLDASGTATFSGLPAGTYTLTSVEYTGITLHPDSVGCTTTITGESVTINEPPTVDAGLDATICEGDDLNLTTVGAVLGGTNPSGSWSSSGSSGTISGGIYTPSSVDIFNGSVTLTYTNTPSDGICPAVSDTMVVTINQAPTVDAGVDQTICSSDTVTMTASFGGSATSGTWSGGTGTFSGNAPNATYTPGVGETGTVILTYTSNDPAGPCNLAIDTVEITIDQGATVDAGTDQTICEGDTVNLALATFGGSATSASWNTSGTGTFAGNIYTPSVADINNGSVLLTYTTNNPTGICNAASDSMLVTINPAPTVSVGTNQSVCSTSNTINMNATLGGGASSGTWSTSGDGSFNNDNPNAVYTFGANDITNGSVTLTYTTNNPTGPCIAANDSFVVSIIPYITANPTYTFATNNGDCSDTVINLNADGTGTWTAVSVPAGSPFTFSSTTDPNATFTGESGTEYNITWEVDNLAPCGDNSATTNVVFTDCGNQIDFDGADDSVNFANNYNLPTNFSIEAWIKPNAINGSIQTILSKRNATNFATGYDLRLVNNTISFRANGSAISANGITSNRWYHIAVTYNGTNYTLYVDGVQRNNTTGPRPTSNTFNMLLGAMSRTNNTPTNYFNGWIDEVRIWNTNLTTTQVRQMMNQEIENNGGLVRGSEVPLDISGLTWGNLIAYYQMNQGTDIAGGNLNSSVGVPGVLRNMTSDQGESAPLPYVSAQNGLWETSTTWENGAVQMLPNTNGVDWNIVRTQHNVTSGNRATTLLGLIVDNNRYTINNNQELHVNNYLRIDAGGVLDLDGESQLLQPTGSIVDYAGNGALHRDQQGTSNLYNYNYWSPPVSSNGVEYQVGSVLYDGPDPVNWTPDHNATGSNNPVTLSSRWLYLYRNNPANTYNDWYRISPADNVPVGLGYTMKGSGVGHYINDDQNYTFVGKPNNGPVSVPITANYEALVGNPYPSAIDVDQFIDDNVGNITGSLYFWEHSITNQTHILVDYQGGYAVRNRTTGIAATSPPGINGIGAAGVKIPQPYIAVAQGFYVHAESSNANVLFNNNQRAFRTESGGSSIFFRTGSEEDANRDEQTEDLIKLIRLDFTSPEGAIRHLALGFTPNNEATEDVDYGYDAKNLDYYPSDMSFIIENEKYVIQGVGQFDVDNMYPVTLDLGIEGNIQIELDELENFDEEIDVYVYDALLGTYSRINTVPYQITLDAGSHANRYFIAFKEDATLDVVDEQFSDVLVNYLSASNEIYIQIPTYMDIKQVYLVNMLGQTVRSWNETNAPLSHESRLPVKNISEGTYVVKVRTSDNALINKKIVVKQD